MTKLKKQGQPFWLGGAAASMAACFTHPLDQTKYRMQVMATRQNMLRTLIQFAGRDGIPSLWWGISASMLRQSTYSTTRFGLYNYFAHEARQRTGQQRLSSSLEIACAGFAGGFAGLVGNPTEVALVRMCADGAKPPAQRFGYKHAFDALVRIGREEGLRTFTRGLGPNVVRSVIMSESEVSASEYSAAKHQLLANPFLSLKDGMPAHFLASLLAGTVATTACAPADVLKSRVQNAVAVDGSVSKIVIESLRNEGPQFLMKGWTPAWLRLAPNTVLTFIFMEQLQKLVNLSRNVRSGEPAPAAVPAQKI
ncbi:uncharacterized protein Z518_05718 [Rhinocladiella mackenziei CBS 650.93]|uniref:Mitochondrial thiamine pyrophosphate carrier 1 n=1 Tax=Rhinocladiella mackenziei CBS 650.93 TaxID=1442369 RepID=A0A0D2FRQ4_9EURO|nr:uncharacterized protein Z518_05718 [Rhinocladiella mackenziei CBS 650.93]KIX04847.1 hypothetical protein Z518_05718 [Rhinocladiella mackenziei CBS 650.93]